MSLERAYEESELKLLTRPQLLALVRGQIERWPATSRGRGLNEKRVTKSQLTAALLNPANHFTTTAPRAAAHPLAPLGWTPGYPTNVSPSSSAGVTAVGALPTFSVNPQQISAPSSNGGSSTTALNTTQHQQVPDRVLPLYMDDYRYGKEPLRTKVELHVPVADGTGGRPGSAYRVAAHDILERLQHTPGFITGQGRAKIGVPDVEDPEYTCYFVQAAVADLANAPASPEFLTVPAGPKQKLVLRIHDAPDNFVEHKPEPRAESDARAVSHSSTETRAFKLSRTLSKHAQSAEKREEDSKIVRELKDAASKCSDYDFFHQSQNHVLQNPHIPRFWKYAANFLKEYYKQPSSAVANRNITKAHIYAALDVGETWLRQAEDGDRLIGTFGAGGTRPVEEVIEEIAQERTPPRGSGQLYEFLSRWENAHPV